MSKVKDKKPTERIIISDTNDIPAFETEAEEQVWWETHALDVELFSRPKERPSHLPPPRTSKKSKGISLRVEDDIVARLKSLAKKKGMGYQTLLKAFVLERLYEEEKREGVFSGE